MAAGGFGGGTVSGAQGRPVAVGDGSGSNIRDEVHGPRTGYRTGGGVAGKIAMRYIESGSKHSLFPTLHKCCYVDG